MKLKDALLSLGWEAFQNNQKEAWNVSDTVHDPFVEDWMNTEVVIAENEIIEVDGDDFYTEYK